MLVYMPHTFNIHIASKRFSSCAIEDIDISEQHFAIWICTLDRVLLRLQRRIEVNEVVRIQRVHVVVRLVPRESIWSIPAGGRRSSIDHSAFGINC